MEKSNEKNVSLHKPWKKVLCFILSVIIAFGTFVTFTFGNSRFQKWLGINSVLSAYASDIVDTKGAAAIDEESMLADDHSINLENRDGTNTVYLFSEPISYTDENGKLKTKDISVEKSDKELENSGYEYTNGQNDYRINFSKDYNIGVQAEFDDCAYSIIPISDCETVGDETVAQYLSEKFEAFEYKDIYGSGTNLRFYPQLNGIKDEIVLNNDINKYDFSFRIETENCTALLNEDGTVVLADSDNNIVQTFSKPFAYDSDFIQGIYDEHYIDCQYTLEEISDGVYTLTVSVDENWLKSDSTVYPVVIDPTTGNSVFTEEAGIYTGMPNNNYGSEQTGCMGLDRGYGYGRVLTYFPMPSGINKGAVINSAYSWQRETTGATTTSYIRPYILVSGWMENSVTWNNRPSYRTAVEMPRKLVNSASTDKSGNPYWYRFDITAAVQAWTDGSYHNYGVMFISSDDLNNTYDWRAFASRSYNTSAMRPYYVINYTNDLIAPTVTSVTGNTTEWTNGNVTLTVNGAKDNTGGIGMHTASYSFSTTPGEYDWRIANSLTFTSNCTVYIYVRDAWDNKRLVSTQVIDKIDKTAPSVPEVTGNSTDWTADTVTLTASSDDAESGIKDYSFSTAQGVYSWQTQNTKTFDSNTTVYVYARDNAGNISSPQEINIDKITDNPILLAEPQFYEYDQLIGIYNPRKGIEDILYKIGDDGEWQTYSAPFALPYGQQSQVYAKFESSGDYEITSTFNFDTANIGAYNEINTDFSLSYKNVNFEFIRRYDSISKKWMFSADSAVTVVNDYIVNAVMPDGLKLAFVKSNENTYTEEINGYILTVLDSGYAININGITYTYDSQGKISSVSNKYGNTISLARTDNAVLITDGANRAYTLALDSNGNIISVTDPADNTITYAYDSNGNLTKVTDQAGVTIGQYSYTNGVLTKSMDKTVNYTTDGRVASYVYDSGAYVNYTYDDENKTISTLSSTENTTSQIYNDALMIVSSTDEDGNTTEYTYDEYYRTITETKDGNTITYTYDTKGNVLSEISGDEDAENTYYIYDANGNIIRQQTGDDYTYSVYNDNNELILSAVLKEHFTGEIPAQYSADLDCFDTVAYTYDNGMLIKTVDSKANETVTNTYDTYGNSVKITTLTEKDGSSTVGVVDSTYDIMGNLLTSVSGEDTSSYIYDKAGRTLLANEKGECTRTLYDNLGRTIQEISPEDYDSTKDGLPNANTYADSNAGQTYVYAANGTLTKETNRLGKTTKYYYNDIGCKVREEFDIYKFYYLNHGELYQVKVANVTTVSYSYSTDGKHLLLSENYANDDMIRYTYNDNGNVTAQYHNSNANPYVTYTYNADNELTEKVNTDTGLKYVYGENNTVSVYKISDNTLVQSYTETETEADEENNITAKTDITESHFGTAYSSVVKDKSISYTIGSNTVEYSYQTNGDDENEKLVSDIVKNGDATAISSAYTYDNDGNITKKALSFGNTSLNSLNIYDSKGRITSTGYDGLSANYFYDENDQIIRVNNSISCEVNYTSTYTYDERGNVTSKNVYDYTSSESITSQPIETTNFTYANFGWKDLLIAVNDVELTYDEIGNVLTYGDREFTWNTGRNLESIVDGENEYSYTYDENGIRTSKTVNGVTTYYNTKDGVILSQTDGTNTMYFQYDTNGVPLGFIYNGTQYLYVTNIMGDVISITDAQGNEIVEYEYDEWGGIASIFSPHNSESEVAFANINPIRYRGYYCDTETGYYYLQSRYYDPSICRFINADIPEVAEISKDIIDGMNLFAYCSDNPVNNYDFDGYKQTKITYKNVYIFYDPDDFYRQAKDEQNYWKKKIRYSIVQIVSIRNRSSFIQYWNSKVKKDSIVVWIFHGGPYHIHTTRDDFTSQYVSKLVNFSIDELYIYACNCGHKDVKYNIANRLKSRLTRTKKIYAMDGSISYYLDSKKYKGYRPRLSANQSHYYRYASIISYRNRYGSIIRYSRPPTGLYRVK